MTRASKIFAACFVGWLFLTLGYFAFYYDDLLSIFTPLAGGTLFLVGIALVIFGGIVAIKSKTRTPVVTAVIVTAVAITGWFTPFGKTMGAHCKLWREKDFYEFVIAEVGEGKDESKHDFPVLVDTDSAVRVAFSWGGILDNWRGIVYDPTGEVMKANILDLKTWENRSDADYASVSMLFGGTLIRAQHLGGDWYLCWFT